jgi:hypothetical protein
MAFYPFVSLLEMLTFNASAFAECVNKLAMLEMAVLTQMQVMTGTSFGMSAESWQIVTDQADTLCRLCEEMGLVMSAKSAHKVSAQLHGVKARGWQAGDVLAMHPDDRKVLIDLLAEVYGRFRDELSASIFVQVDPHSVSLYQPIQPLFGSEVATAFPLADEDIEEAGKCIALERFTAAVFHLMRAMECAVKALSSKLGISNTDRVWGNLLSDMHAKIEAMPKGKSRDQWSESHSLLYHVKQAWRNDVMHPKETYTAEQARDVLQAVRSFMRHLATLT